MITKLSSLRAATAARSLAHIVSAIDERFARKMAAALGQLLVFQLDRGRAGRFQLDDRSLDVQRLAEARIGIDDHREVDAPCQIGRVLGQFAEREQADVGQAQDAGREDRAGEIHRLEPGLLDQPRGQGVRRQRRGTIDFSTASRSASPGEIDMRFCPALVASGAVAYWLRFLRPPFKPDVRISRIRLLV